MGDAELRRGDLYRHMWGNGSRPLIVAALCCVASIALLIGVGVSQLWLQGDDADLPAYELVEVEVVSVQEDTITTRTLRCARGTGDLTFAATWLRVPDDGGDGASEILPGVVGDTPVETLGGAGCDPPDGEPIVTDLPRPEAMAGGVWRMSSVVEFRSSDGDVSTSAITTDPFKVG